MTRRTAVLAVASCGLVLLAVAAAPWLVVPTSTAISSDVVNVPGSQAVPAVPAAAAVLLAAALALALSGRVSRVLAAGTVTLAGAVVLLSIGTLVRSPEAATVAAVASTTGVRQAEVGASLTLWPVVAGAVGAAVCAAGAFITIPAGRWRGADADRYDRPGSQPEVPGEGREAGQGQVRAAAGGSPGDRAREDWDALTRGDDPS